MRCGRREISFALVRLRVASHELRGRSPRISPWREGPSRSELTPHCSHIDQSSPRGIGTDRTTNDHEISTKHHESEFVVLRGDFVVIRGVCPILESPGLGADCGLELLDLLADAAYERVRVGIGGAGG